MKGIRPSADHYPAMLAIAVIALVPYIVTTAADLLYSPGAAAKELGASETAVGMFAGLSVAGYAFGALLGGDLINRFPQRRLFLIIEALFVFGALLTATAGSAMTYGAGRVIAGLCTGLMLVIALPPVIRRFPPERLPVTMLVINIGFFGAVTIGPVIGGLVAAFHAWRLFSAALAGLAAAGWVLAFVTLPDDSPDGHAPPLDISALALGLAATVLPFWAVGELTSSGFGAPTFIVPMALGLAALVALLMSEYKKQEPLAPIKMMWSTFPVVGTLVAMVAGGAVVAFLTLAVQSLLQVGHQTPLAVGLSLWPEIAGVLVSAITFSLILRTRIVPIFILVGMSALIASGALLTQITPIAFETRLLIAAGLLGLGAGATVSPGLDIAAFSVPSGMVGRVMALVELVRSLADFILAPVMLEVARLSSRDGILTQGGVTAALEITILIVIVLTLFGVALYLAARPGLPRPDFRRYIVDHGTALDSPPLLAAMRNRQSRGVG